VNLRQQPARSLTSVDFRLLGPVQIQSTDGQIIRLNRRKERLALAVLLLQPGRVVTTDRLIDLLWAQTPPATARTTLQTLMSRIRGALRTAANHDTDDERVRLQTHGQGYVLRIEPESVDLHRFRTLVDQAKAITDPQLRSARLADALRLWRGPALADAAAGALRQQLCHYLEESRFAAISDRIDADLAVGRHAELIPELSGLVAEHPLREQVHGQLMVALYRCGRRADALDAYRLVRRTLITELGLEPGPRLRGLEAAILADAPHLDTGTDHHAAAGAPPAPAQLPPDLGGFVGRTPYLWQLDTLLADQPESTRPAAMLITGTAGVGKTALAVHWAHRVRSQFPDGHLYVNLRGFGPAGSVRNPSDVLRSLLAALRVPAARIPGTLQPQIDLYRGLLAGQRVLIVLDNARDAEQVRPLLPGSPSCLTVVTSRNRLSSLVTVEGAHPIALDLLTTAEAHELLTSRLGTALVGAEPAAVDEIITRCARLPLALAVVAARAASNPSFPLTAIADELRDVDTGLDAFDGGDPATHLRTVFSRSYDTLSAAAARLFRLLGLHPGPDIATPAAASLAGVPVRQARVLLAELSRAHLINEHIPGRFTFHDLLRAYATELVHVHDTERRSGLHRMLDHYLRTAHTAHRLLNPHLAVIALDPAQPTVTPEDLADDGQALSWFTAEHPVLIAAVLLAADAGFDTYTWQLAWTLETFFMDQQGHWQDLIVVQNAALDATQRLADRRAQAHAHRGLGRAYLQLGRHDDSYASLRHALELFVELADHTGQAHIHLGISIVYDQQTRYQDALGHARQALGLYRTSGNRAGEARALNSVGWYHAKLGDHRQAITHCQRALPSHRQVRDRLGEAHTWDSLGYAHYHLGDHDQAADCYRRALDRYRTAGDRYHQAVALTRLGDTQHAAGDSDEAGDAWRLALEIFAELGHSDAEQIRAGLDPFAPQPEPPAPGGGQ
jgi:DNA-binding SARP family transcriptional activator/tetratricopeptide (TPR) repeat protein